MKLSEKIKKFREKAGLTQEQLAEKMEVQRNTVWRWENQKANLKADNIHKLSTVLHVDTSDLIDDEDELHELKVSSNLANMKVPTKVVMSTKPSSDVLGRIIVKDGDFYVNLPDSSEGYAALLKIVDRRSNVPTSSVAVAAVPA